MMRGGIRNIRKKYFKDRISFVVLCIFIIFFLVGVFTFDQYDIFTDAAAQRRHSLVCYQWLNEKLFHREIPYITNLGLPPLPEYKSRYYGVILQLLPVVIEDMNGFNMPLRSVYIIRHIYCYFIYYIALICFYHLIKEILGSRKISISGVLMLYLFPSFFEAAFTNIKDLLFVSIFIMSLYLLVKITKYRKGLLWYILFSLTSAVATSIRIIGIIIPLSYVGYLVVEAICCWLYTSEVYPVPLIKRQRRELAENLIWVVGLFIVFYGLSMPVILYDPIGFIRVVIKKALNYDVWNGKNLFNGQLLSWDEMPIYYLPFFMAITIPVYVQLLFFVGVGKVIMDIIRKKGKESFINNRYIWLAFEIFLVPFLFQVIMHIKIYGRWRHMYLLYPPFCIIASYGFQCICNYAKKKKNRFADIKIISGVMIFCFAISIGRIITCHPYEDAMFNYIGVALGGDKYYCAHQGFRECYEYLLEYDNEEIIVIKPMMANYLDAVPGDISRIIENGEDYNYYIYDYRYGIDSSQEEGFKEIYDVSIDGYKLASLYQREIFIK